MGTYNDDGADPTRGTGADKETVAADPDFDASQSEPSGPEMTDPSRGGCLKLGWGCLPVSAGLALLPIQHFFF